MRENAKREMHRERGRERMMLRDRNNMTEKMTDKFKKRDRDR